MFLFKKRDSARRKTIERLYGAIVAQARNPVFYRDMGVPDTVEGRFDFLVLHIHLLNARLAAAGEPGVAFGQELLDHFFEDMDASLREIGIGDLTVPKKMRTLAEAYLGRSAAYARALESNDRNALAEGLARNVVGTDKIGEGQALAAYALRAATALRSQQTESIYAGDVYFPDPVEASTHAG
jgi:cytochrome b pre-mRNA-processing protein 3